MILNFSSVSQPRDMNVATELTLNNSSHVLCSALVCHLRSSTAISICVLPSTNPVLLLNGLLK